MCVRERVSERECVCVKKKGEGEKNSTQILKKKSGDVNDSKISLFFFYFKRAKPYTGAHPCEGMGHADT